MIQLWLFEEPPVTWPEVWQWVENTVGLKQDSPRAAYYAEYWNVADKIRAIKRSAATFNPPAKRRHTLPIRRNSTVATPTTAPRTALRRKI